MNIRLEDLLPTDQAIGGENGYSLIPMQDGFRFKLGDVNMNKKNRFEAKEEEYLVCDCGICRV